MEWRCVVPNRTTRPKGGRRRRRGRASSTRRVSASRAEAVNRGSVARASRRRKRSARSTGTTRARAEPEPERGVGGRRRERPRGVERPRGANASGVPEARARVRARGARRAATTNSQFADEASAQRRDVCPGRFGAPACRFTARKDFFPCGGSRLALLDVSGATRALATSPRASVASEPNGDHASPSCLPGRAPGARPRRARPPLARPTAATFRVSSPRAHPSLGSIV